MSQYTIQFLNDTTHELMEEWQNEQNNITARDIKAIIDNLCYYIARSYKNDNMTAYIYRGKFLTLYIQARTKSDSGNAIITTFNYDGRYKITKEIAS